jgi:hypothetical protein
MKEKTKYDRSAYLKMLVSAAETLFGVFGYTQDKVWEAIRGERQGHHPLRACYSPRL